MPCSAVTLPQARLRKNFQSTCYLQRRVNIKPRGICRLLAVHYVKGQVCRISLFSPSGEIFYESCGKNMMFCGGLFSRSDTDHFTHEGYSSRAIFTCSARSILLRYNIETTSSNGVSILPVEFRVEKILLMAPTETSSSIYVIGITVLCDGRKLFPTKNVIKSDRSGYVFL